MAARVLIVDDASVVLDGLKAFLECLGCSVWTADGGLRALAAIQEREFDVVFLDCIMPGMDGLETAQAIRRLGGPMAAVRIVGMRTSSLAMHAQRCREAGMDDSLEKVPDADAFEAVLRRWFPQLGTADHDGG